MYGIRTALFFGILCGMTPTLSFANDRLDCTVTSPMKDQVGEGGYSFSAYSNLATMGDQMCLQHILRNHEGNTAAKVSWYEPTESGPSAIISVQTLPGCYDNVPNQECDCKTTPCQVSREFYADSFGIQNILSTAEFGIQAGQYTDVTVKARNIRLVGFLKKDDAKPSSVTPKSTSTPQGGADEFETDGGNHRYAILDLDDGNPSQMTTKISGFPAGSDGAPISLDLYFHSTAYRSGDGYLIENYISRETGFENFFVAQLSSLRSGNVELGSGPIDFRRSA